MSELLPNLPALIDALPAGVGGADSRQLASAAEVAKSEADLDAAIAGVIAGWLAK
jgi:hypothetical protein